MTAKNFNIIMICPAYHYLTRHQCLTLPVKYMRLKSETSKTRDLLLQAAILQFVHLYVVAALSLTIVVVLILVIFSTFKMHSARLLRNSPFKGNNGTFYNLRNPSCEK